MIIHVALTLVEIGRSRRRWWVRESVEGGRGGGVEDDRLVTVEATGVGGWVGGAAAGSLPPGKTCAGGRLSPRAFPPPPGEMDCGRRDRLPDPAAFWRGSSGSVACPHRSPPTWGPAKLGQRLDNVDMVDMVVHLDAPLRLDRHPCSPAPSDVSVIYVIDIHRL